MGGEVFGGIKDEAAVAVQAVREAQQGAILRWEGDAGCAFRRVDAVSAAGGWRVKCGLAVRLARVSMVVFALLENALAAVGLMFC